MNIWIDILATPLPEFLKLEAIACIHRTQMAEHKINDKRQLLHY
jgi:hypothetical protein